MNLEMEVGGAMEVQKLCAIFFSARSFQFCALHGVYGYFCDKSESTLCQSCGHNTHN